VLCPNLKQSDPEEQPPRAQLRLVVGLRPDVDERILSDVFVPRRAAWRGVAASLALHVLLVMAAPWIVVVAEWLDLNQNSVKPRFTFRQPLRIQLPDRMYYTASRKPSPSPPAEPRLPEPARRSVSKPAVQKPAIPTPVREAANPPRKFELPVSPAKPKAEPLVLQPPQQSAELAARLPQVMFWARETPRLQAPAAKPFVRPGRVEAAAPRPDLAAPPRLDAPNQEPRISDLNIASALASVPHPALVLPPSSATIPVRLLDQPPGELRSGSIEGTAGDPANLIVLSSDPLPPNRVMTVPGGNNLGSLPEPGNGTGSGTGTGAASEPAVTAKASGAGTGAGDGTDAGFGDLREGGQLEALLPSIPIRMIRPANGDFDLVIVQSSLPDLMPKTTGMLSGQPVYSVYLHLGAGKDWILQYCEPHSKANFQRTKNIVNLADAYSIDAPFPRLMVAPDLEALDLKSYTIIHGTLSAAGQLSDLTLKTGPEKSPLRAILPLLQQWEFRPATKNGQPVEVEVLFAIPPARRF
jgi:hypothetical protein